jgi:hypothetical protein
MERWLVEWFRIGGLQRVAVACLGVEDRQGDVGREQEANARSLHTDYYGSSGRKVFLGNFDTFGALARSY